MNECHISNSDENICKYYNNSISNGKIPFFATPLQIQRNKKWDFVSSLIPLEKRPVAPRMAFAQIMQLCYKTAQLGLTISIINIPAYLDKIQHMFPQNLEDLMAIAVMLKRKLEYKNTYLFGNVQPMNVITTLNSLCKTMMY